jgi:hypothetical protein
MINVEILNLNIGISYSGTGNLFWDVENLKIMRVFKCATNLFRRARQI